MIEVPVMDWAPHGLGPRFAALYATCIWHMVLSFATHDEPTIKLYTLIAMYLPALVLHDSRASMQHRNELEPTTSNRGSINARLKQAEGGNWIPLFEELLQAHVNKDPNKEAKEAL
jgi:hypothetical protein